MTVFAWGEVVNTPGFCRVVRLHEAQKHRSAFVFYVNLWICPQTSLPNIDNDISQMLSVSLPFIPPLCNGTVDVRHHYWTCLRQSKIWCRIWCSFYVNKVNRRGLWITSCFCDNPEPVWQRNRVRKKNIELCVCYVCVCVRFLSERKRQRMVEVVKIIWLY